MEKQTFEEYLQDIHMEGYTGTDDDSPDAFDSWLVELDGEEYIKYAQEWGDKITEDLYGYLEAKKLNEQD